jgi:hypothetical protein
VSWQLDRRPSVRVDSVDQVYEYDPESTATPDGYSVLSARHGKGRWLRRAAEHLDGSADACTYSLLDLGRLP